MSSTALIAATLTINGAMLINSSACIVCGTFFPQTRPDRQTCSPTCSKRNYYVIHRKGKTIDDEPDFCPICEFMAANTAALDTHMKDKHNRLIIEQDINEARARRQAKYRALDIEEELLLA